MILDVYAASETPIPGADGKALCQAMRQRGDIAPVFVRDTDEALELMANFSNVADILLIQGAGNVSAISTQLRGGHA